MIRPGVDRKEGGGQSQRRWGRIAKEVGSKRKETGVKTQRNSYEKEGDLLIVNVEQPDSVNNVSSIIEDNVITVSESEFKGVLKQIEVLKEKILIIQTASMYRLFFIGIGIGVLCFIFGFLYGKAH